MHLNKQFFCGLLAASLCLGALAGCAAPSSAPAPESEPSSSAIVSEVPAASSEAVTRTVVDYAGHEVTLPTEINRIVITSITPLLSVYSLFEGSSERLIGMSPSSMASTKNSLLADTIPGITEVRTDFMNGSEINMEELLAMKPDVVFYRAEQEEEYDKLTAAGIPAVGFSTTKWESDSIETFEGWVTLLGEVLQQQDRADGIAEYGREVYNMIQSRFAEAGESLERPRILFLFRYSNGVIQTSGSKHFGEYWANSTGGVNAAHETESANFEINMEQVYEYDPDMIYITNFVPYLPEDLYNNAIEGHDWSVVRAVQEKKVYKCPLGMYRWYPPSSDTPLMLLWMSKNNHPELFEDIDMTEELKSYYKRFYNVELTEENIEKIFNPSREAAGA